MHASLKRLEGASLADNRSGRPILRAVEEFLIHAVKYVFPTQQGETTRGLPTAYAAPPLNDVIAGSGEPPPVWPDPEGEVRGVGFEPLCKSVARAARRDAVLYELLALVDALRDGRARERAVAERALSSRLRELLRG